LQSGFICTSCRKNLASIDQIISPRATSLAASGAASPRKTAGSGFFSDELRKRRSYRLEGIPYDEDDSSGRRPDRVRKRMNYRVSDDEEDHGERAVYYNEDPLTPIITDLGPGAADIALRVDPRKGLEPEPLTAAQQAIVPEWLPEAVDVLLKKRPKDFFFIVVEGRSDVRLKCYDCAKTYMPGPNQTLTNFDVHLKNQHHHRLVSQRIRSLVQKEMAAGVNK
jgi:hypothetical protein